MEKEKYDILLSELATALQNKDTTIFLLRCEIADLKKKLEEAEKAAEGKDENN